MCPIRHVVEIVRNRENPGLPWWSSGKESTCQRRGHGFHPRSRRLPGTAGQLSPCATTTEPTLCNKGSTARRSLCATLGSSPHVQQQRPSMAKKKKKNRENPNTPCMTPQILIPKSFFLIVLHTFLLLDLLFFLPACIPWVSHGRALSCSGLLTLCQADFCSVPWCKSHFVKIWAKLRIFYKNMWYVLSSPNSPE